MTENDIATQIVDACYKVHTTLGPGLLESVYEAVLGYVKWSTKAGHNLRWYIEPSTRSV